MGNDGNGLVEALLGLPGFRVLAVAEGPDELVVTVETVLDRVGCTSCGVRAKAQDRMAVAVRDLACFGRLVWIKRRWRCVDVDCSAKTWTEASEHVGAQVVLTRRGGVEACRQVGELARPVATVAAELGVCWWTVMNAVVEHGTPLVDDPERIGAVRQLGVDETSFLAANRQHCTIYATGLVDLQAKVVIDMVEGNRAADLRTWTAKTDPTWLAGIEVVATAWPSRSGPDCLPISITPGGWPIPSTWCAPPTAAWTRCADGSKTRPLATVGARPTRCIGSASCCSRPTNDSTRPVTIACCSAWGRVIPATRCWGHGWPRSR